MNKSIAIPITTIAIGKISASSIANNNNNNKDLDTLKIPCCFYYYGYYYYIEMCLPLGLIVAFLCLY